MVQLHKPPGDQKNYVVDRIIKSHGHIPLRTPPYMCELNPIELIWAQLKHYVRSHNTTGDVPIKILMELIEQGFASITPVDLAKCCKHVVDIEDHFWETDQQMEEVQPLIIQLTNDSSDDDDSDDTDGES